MRDRGPARIALYDVTLAEIEPGQRVRALAVVRRLFDMSLEEAGEALDAVPMPMARRVSEEIATELRDAFAGVATVTLREVESQPNPLHGPLRTDRFLSGGRPRFEDEPSFDEIEPEGPREGPCGEFELGAQLCSSCGARATLVGDPMQLGATCPACREDALECVESWTT